ncbi:E3 ubiquitin-protein ligase RBBP6 isoform X3 [Dermacentor silvarum]|uniref:E3 ubiquitin-protein ligase RBBP6 isoform X3 n=1 Tax=Dermacentor silvarum TaxID=543639 RepID=UPI0021017262|nr:E3 ubiquitin-protein ligase RBBP6 isoform X3 [Dermacentor silvarum]
MSVHYKFKSSLDFDTVTFDGLHISVGELKKNILQQKKIGKAADFDLQITNAQTKEVYTSDDYLIPKNTSVIVARVPVTTTGRKNCSRERNRDGEHSVPDTSSPGRNYEKLAKTADLANSSASEDDKIKAMMSQSSQEYDPSKYVKSRSMTGPLPPNYTCFRCGKSGHWIKNCPTNNIEVKRSTGIPRSFMVTVDGPDHKGALLTSTGEFAVPLIDHEAYKEVKKEKPPFVREPTPEPVQEPQLPDELLCMICHDLLQDAVLIPCCGNSFCDECVRQALLDSEQHECPVCHETDISPNNLIPNRFLRTAVLNFKNETGYTRIRRGQLSAASASAAEAAATGATSTSAASSPRIAGGEEGSVTPPPTQSDEQDADKKSSPAKKAPASLTEEKTAREGADDGTSLEVAGATSVDDTSRSPGIGTPSENPPGTPLADENPDEPAGPSLDEALTMSPQHRSHDENSPPSRTHHTGGSPSSLGNGEESVCAIATITTRVPSYTGPITMPGRSNRDASMDHPRVPSGRGSLHRSSRHGGDYGHHRSRHDYGPGGSLRSGGDYRSGGYPPYSGSGGGMSGGSSGGNYPPPPLHLPPPPQGHHMAPPNLPPPPFPGQAPPPPGLTGMNVAPPHFPVPSAAGYMPPAKPFGPGDDYHNRRRSYTPRSQSRSYSRSRSRSRSPVRHRRSRSPRSPRGGEGRRRAGSKSPHGRRSRSGSYRSRSRSPSRSTRRSRHHYHGGGSGRAYRRSRTPRSPRSYHHHPLPPPPPHHLTGPPPHSYRGRSPSFRGARRGFYGGPSGGYQHHPGYPHHPSEHMVPPVEFDGRGGHYYPPHHHRDGIGAAYRGYPPGYPPGAPPPPPHRGDSRGSDRYEGGGPPGPMGVPSRAYHGDPGSRRERPRGDCPPPPEAVSERSPKGSRESRSREHRRHGEAITTPLVVSREGTEGKEGTRLEAEGPVKSRKRSKDKEEKLLRHKHHHKSKESRKESKERAAGIQEGAVKKASKASAVAPPEGEKQAAETKAEESPASTKEMAKMSQEVTKAEGEETLSEGAAAAVKERKHKHKKKLKQEEALKKMAAKIAARTSDESSQQLPGADDEPLKRKKKKKKLREARLLTKSLLLTPPMDLSREQSMVAFLTAELEQGVPDAARLSKIEEQLELAKKKLLSDEREEAKGEVATAEETRRHVKATQDTVDTIWDKTELEPEQKEGTAPKEEENVLQVEVPELSKWEREELEGEESPLPPSEPLEEAKETKPMVSSEVLQRAENVLLHKPRKKAMVAVAAATAALARPATASEPKKLPSKVASPDNSQPVAADESSQSSVREVKEGWRDPSVPLRLRDRLDGTLQVTITSTEKERRSVTTSDKEQRGSSSEGTQQTKRVKLDRSKFGEKRSRGEGGEASDSAKPLKSSSRRDDRGGGRLDDRASLDHDRRLPPEDVRSRLEDRRALEAAGHSRVLLPGRSDRDLSRSSRSGRPREKELPHRSSSRDMHPDERRRHKEERYYAAMMEERARRAYEEAHYKRMEVEMSHSRRKAPDEHRSRHAAEDAERLRMHERCVDAPRLRSKSADRGNAEDPHRSRRGDWSAEQMAAGGSLSVVSQPSQRSRSKDKSEKERQRHHKDKSSHVAVSSAATLSAAGGSVASGQESRAPPSTTSKQPEKKVSPTLASLESALRHRKESTQDESRFEPDYDEMIEDEPGSSGTTDPALLQGSRSGSSKRRAVTVVETLASKKSRLAEEEALAPAKSSASPAASTAPAASAVVAAAALVPPVSADDRSSSSSSDSSDEGATSHKKHKKKHKKHKKHKHKHKKKKKSKKADKSD